ncbi:MAG: radical SAM protein [Methanosarcinales archaeon]
MKKVRASLGTLGVLGMELINMDNPPTTAYLQLYTDQRCNANCLFCAQASGARSDLKRIAKGWYIPVDLEEVVRRLGIAFEKNYLKRVCIQTALYNGMWKDLTYLISCLRNKSKIPISVSVFPLSTEKYKALKKLGVEHLIIPLDACNETLFNKIKNPFKWELHLNALERAVGIFGKYKVGTHLILGLGESQESAISLLFLLQELGVHIALFAYTPIPRTKLIKNPPSIKHYRIIQIAYYLIQKNLIKKDQIKFKHGNLIDFGISRTLLEKEIENGEPFITSGCKDCNRPYATETPLSIYNYPSKPNKEEIEKIKKQLENFIK